MKPTLLLLSLLLWICSSFPALTAAEPTRVLFVGNSYSFKVPKLFSELAKSGGKKIEVAQLTKGGWTLAKHSASEETMEKISGTQWDVIVFQEQSQIPSFPDAANRMNAPAQKLVDAAKNSGARTIYYETWGRRDGDTRNRKGDTFAAMQKRLTAGYAGVAKHTKSEVAPVGQAWSAVQKISKGPGKDLWSKDGSHPSARGAYLAACVFYSVIFKSSPKGLTYHAQLPEDEAATYQETASNIALPR